MSKAAVAWPTKSQPKISLASAEDGDEDGDEGEFESLADSLPPDIDEGLIKLFIVDSFKKIDQNGDENPTGVAFVTFGIGKTTPAGIESLS